MTARIRGVPIAPVLVRDDERQAVIVERRTSPLASTRRGGLSTLELQRRRWAASQKWSGVVVWFHVKQRRDLAVHVECGRRWNGRETESEKRVRDPVRCECRSPLASRRISRCQVSGSLHVPRCPADQLGRASARPSGRTPPIRRYGFWSAAAVCRRSRVEHRVEWRRRSRWSRWSGAGSVSISTGGRGGRWRRPVCAASKLAEMVESDPAAGSGASAGQEPRSSNRLVTPRR